MRHGLRGSRSADEQNNGEEEDANDSQASDYTTDDGTNWCGFRGRRRRCRKLGMTGLIYLFRFSLTKFFTRPSRRFYGEVQFSSCLLTFGLTIG